MRISTTCSRGRAGVRWPSRPIMSSLATRALTTASSVAWTTASKNGSRCSQGTNSRFWRVPESGRKAPEFAVEGAMVYQANMCAGCHQVNGNGMKVGPPLNGLEKRRTKTWVEQHFAQPQMMSPNTIMPPYKFSPVDLDQITAYLFSLE